MQKATNNQSNKNTLYQELTSKSVTRYLAVPPPPKLPRPESPRRPNQASPRDESEKKANPYSMFRGELDSYSDELLAWVSRRCPQDAWDHLKSRSSEPGAPPWLNGEALGLDQLSHKVLALGIAHSICQHGTMEECPFPKGDDLECNLALYKLAMLPPVGMFELFRCLEDGAPLRKQGLIAVNESLTPRRKRFEGNAFSVGRFLRTQFSVNVSALGGLIGIQPTEDGPVGPSLEDLVLPDEVRSGLTYLLANTPSPSRCFTVFLKGSKQTGRRTVARAMANRLGIPLKQCHSFDCPQPGFTLLVDAQIHFDDEDWSLLQEHHGLVFVRQTAGDVSFDLEGRSDLVLDLGALEVGPMVVFSARKLKEAGPLFSACDPFEIAQTGATPGKLIETIERLAREGQWRGHSPGIVKELLIKTLGQTSASGQQVQKYVEEIAPKRTLEELCLEPAAMDRFKRILQSIRGRGAMLTKWNLDPGLVGRAQGVLLFHGPSGTGKSMAAEVLAHELGLPLLRMEATELESAYVGESEQRLNKFFTSAKGKPSVLLLDEADSVLMARASAEGSTKHYQVNLVNTWLRELERFSGILIFTTNHADSIDPALERRIQHRMEFQAPTARVRQRIWEHLFSKAAIPGREELDLSVVADRFSFSGGRTRLAFVDALQRAGEMGQITQQVLVDACEEEQRSALPGKQAKQIRGFAALPMETV